MPQGTINLNLADSALQVKGKSGQGCHKKKGKDHNKECYNCGKKGHISKDCWAKGGVRGRKEEGKSG